MSKGAKVASPTPFDGNRKQTKLFLAQCELVFSAQPDAFKGNDAAKVAYVLSYMKQGLAASWGLRYMEEMATSQKKDTYDEFVAKVKDHFKEYDKGRTARNVIDRLRQGKNSIDAYNAVFNELSKDTGYGDADHMERYKKGLNWAIHQKILELEEQPKTLATLQEKAAKYEDILNRQRDESSRSTKPIYPDTYKGSVARYTPHSYHTTTSWSSDNVDYGEPMDIDALRRQPMSPRERAELMKKGACFRCRKTGHRAHDCPQKSPRRDGNRPAKVRKATVEEINQSIADLTMEEYGDVMMALKTKEADFAQGH